MGMNSEISNLGIRGIHYLEIAVFDATPWLPYLIDGFGFQHIASNTQEDVERTGTRKWLLRVGKCRFVLQQAVRDGSPVAAYLSRHPEGITRVNFEVRDIEFCEKRILEREGNPTGFIETVPVAGGDWKSFSITTALGDVEYGFIQVPENALPPGFEQVAEFDPSHNPMGIASIDHLTSNVRTLQPLISFFQTVMGMERFWKVAFHTDDIKSGVGSGLKSIVTRDPESGVKFANNEPLRPRFNESQIQIYVDDNRGGGVQHVAFLVKDCIQAVDHCNKFGISFLPTPSTYYDAVPERIVKQNMGTIREPLDEVAKRSILVDGENGGYLLQIFCREQAVQFQRPNAGPLFIEIIQRSGAQGFGEGNFRALFESIEREQDQTRDWKAQAQKA